MTSLVGGSGRDRAIEAAARAIEGELGPECIDDDGADALARAAVDAIDVVGLLNDLADSIDREARFDGDQYVNDGVDAAIDVVRAAAAGWGTDA